MKIYRYDQITGEYLDDGLADRNPRNPANPIIPAFATTLEPLPEKDGYTRVFADEVWQYAEIPLPEPEPEPTPEEIQAQMKGQAVNAIQATLDAKARELGFDSIHTAAVWTISKNPARKARADSLVTWADSVWDFAEAEWEKQAAGTPTYTDVESFLAALPEFVEPV